MAGPIISQTSALAKCITDIADYRLINSPGAGFADYRLINSTIYVTVSVTNNLEFLNPEINQTSLKEWNDTQV